MLGHPISFRLALQKIIPALISYTFSESQTVRGKPADHAFHQLCELMERRKAT